MGKVKIESFSALSVDKRALVSWSGGRGGRGGRHDQNCKIAGK